MSEETNNNTNPEVKPVLPEAPAAKPVLPEVPTAKIELPEAPTAKPVLPEAPMAKSTVLPTASKITLPTANIADSKQSAVLPKAKVAQHSFAKAPMQPVKIESDSPSMVSVAVDFVAAAVAVAFAVMIVLDV